MTICYRGEMKTPGGKLVAVEFKIDSNRLRNVTITGDFFLYPEESLPMLTATIEGMPLDSGEEQIRSRISSFLERHHDDITLVGTSPDAIAAAISRALASEQTARS